MSTNSDYVAMMQSQLKKWDKEVDALSASGEKASMEARSAYHEGMKELRASRDEAQRTFQQIRLATEAAGEQMQAGKTVAWVTMQKALEKVSAELKG
jgi:hypothetical protein